MASRNRERERLRTERRAAESEDTAAQLARKRRVQYLTIAGFAAVAVIVALIVISQSGGGSSKPPANVQGAAQVNAQLQGVPQNGQVLGQSSAPVTVTVDAKAAGTRTNPAITPVIPASSALFMRPVRMLPAPTTRRYPETSALCSLRVAP